MKTTTTLPSQWRELTKTILGAACHGEWCNYFGECARVGVIALCYMAIVSRRDARARNDDTDARDWYEMHKRGTQVGSREAALYIYVCYLETVFWASIIWLRHSLRLKCETLVVWCCANIIAWAQNFWLLTRCRARATCYHIWYRFCMYIYT